MTTKRPSERSGLRSSFIPAFNPTNGESFGIFKEYDAKSGTYQLRDKATNELMFDSDGEPVTKDYLITLLNFLVQGQKGNYEVVSLSTNGHFDKETDALHIALVRMGYEFPKPETVIDPETGNAVIMPKGEIDPETGCVVDTESEDSQIDAIYDFLDTIKGEKFHMVIEMDKKGFYRIKPETLRRKNPVKLVE